MGKKIIIFSIIIVIILLGLTGFVLIDRLAASRLVTVRIIEVEKGSIQSGVLAVGQVQAKDRRDIFMPFSARVEDILVREGDRVSKGQPLAQLDITDRLNQVEQARLNLENDRLALSKIDRVHRTDRRIMENKIAVSEMIYNNLLESLDSEEVKNGALISPVDGIVTGIGLRKGMIIQPGSLVFTVSDLDAYSITARISQRDILNIETGMQVFITPDIRDDREYTGIVERIHPAAVQERIMQEEQTVVPVEIFVENSEASLKPGFIVDINIVFAEKENILVVPRESVRFGRGSQRFVFVLNGDRVELRPVKIGIQTDLEMEIVEGLEEGELIVYNPRDDLTDGTRVRVVAREGL